jgi:hypothetical protein
MTELINLSIRGTWFLPKDLLMVASFSMLALWHEKFVLGILPILLWLFYCLFIHKRLDFLKRYVRISSFTKWPVLEILVEYKQIQCLRWESGVQAIASRVVITYTTINGNNRKTTFRCSRSEWKKMVSILTANENSVQIIDR